MLKEFFVRKFQIWVFLQDALFYCTLTDCPSGITAAVARHVSVAQITCTFLVLLLLLLLLIVGLPSLLSVYQAETRGY